MYQFSIYYLIRTIGLNIFRKKCVIVTMIEVGHILYNILSFNHCGCGSYIVNIIQWSKILIFEIQNIESVSLKYKYKF